MIRLVGSEKKSFYLRFYLDGKQDVKAGIDSIYWNVYGKIASIKKQDTTITYSHDAGGNRVSKTVTKPRSSLTTSYFRALDTKAAGKRSYTDLNGTIPNNKVVNGKTSGKSQAEYNQLTHFNYE